MIVVVARHQLRPEHADTFPQQLAAFTSASRQEPGVISFDWTRSTDDHALCFLIEVFNDAAAGEAPVQSEHFKDAIAILPTLLTRPPDIIHVSADGGGWARMAEV